MKRTLNDSSLQMLITIHKIACGSVERALYNRNPGGGCFTGASQI